MGNPGGAIDPETSNRATLIDHFELWSETGRNCVLEVQTRKVKGGRGGTQELNKSTQEKKHRRQTKRSLEAVDVYTGKQDTNPA